MRKPLGSAGSVLLLCERLEIASFMRAYWHYWRRQGVDLPEVKLVNCHSLERLRFEVPKLSGLEKVRRLVILADAVPGQLQQRKNVVSAVRSSTCLQSMEYCAHFFFPGKKSPCRWQQGYLEDVLLQSLMREQPETADICNLLAMGEDYLLSVNNSRGSRLSNHSRHLLYTYFSGTEKFAGMNLGEAALQGAFDLEHPAFDSFKEFVFAL